MAASGVAPGDIAALGLANQRETALLWERPTGQPVGRAIVWQCRRTADLCTQLREEGYTQAIRARTGLLPDAYFSGTKYRWLLDHVPGARRRAEAGELLCGNRGQLAAVEPHRGQGPRLGFFQLLPHHAL